MYNDKKLQEIIDYLSSNNRINKDTLRNSTAIKFNLIKSRSVYYCKDFAIRFSTASSKSFSNCILSLSNLRTFDNIPFIVCVVLPTENYLLLANTTCIKKISHSSQELRVDNIKGTFLGNDILREIDGISNEPRNFKKLFSLHEQHSFNENLERLVKTSNEIVGTKTKSEFSEKEKLNILNAPKRSINFLESKYFTELNIDLTNRLNTVKNEIRIASTIDNVNLRGRIIEYLITSNNSDKTRQLLIKALHENSTLPKFITEDDLGDYTTKIGHYNVGIDIKTELLQSSANPKAYNIDKILKFLSEENSVYLLFFIGINANKEIKSRLCSMFEDKLLKNTRFMKHWSGRNTRGVTQFYGHTTKELLLSNKNNINCIYSQERLKEMINL